MDTWTAAHRVDKWTALHPVDTWQVLETALLSREALGLDVDVADDDGHTPLHVAVAEGGNELVAALLHAKASTGACAHDGSTPLQIAVANGDLQASDHACPDMPRMTRLSLCCPVGLYLAP